MCDAVCSVDARLCQLHVKDDHLLVRGGRGSLRLRVVTSLVSLCQLLSAYVSISMTLPCSPLPSMLTTPIYRGHSFRPDYLRLAQVALSSGAPHVLGLTATATPKVRLLVQGDVNTCANCCCIALLLVCCLSLSSSLSLLVCLSACLLVCLSACPCLLACLFACLLVCLLAL